MAKKSYLYIGLAVMVLAVIFFARSFMTPDRHEKQLVSTPQSKTIPKKDLATHTPATEAKKTDQKALKVSVKDDTMRSEESRHADKLAAVRDALKSPDSVERTHAVLSLRDEKTEEAIGILVQFLEDKDPRVLSEVIGTLTFIGLHSELGDMVFGILEEKAGDHNFVGRNKALVSAAMFGKDDLILPVIGDFLPEKDDELNQEEVHTAARALSFVNSPECLPYVRRLVEISDDPNVQRIVYNKLAKMDSTEASEMLKEILLSDDDKAQAFVAWALSREDNPEFNQTLTEAIKRGELRDDALSMIAKSPSAPAVFGNLMDSNVITNEEKISYLKSIAANTINAPSDIRYGVRSAVAPLLNSTDPNVELEAIITLGKIGGGEGTAKILEDKLTSDSDSIRKAAEEAYLNYTTPWTYKPLLPVIWDKDQNVRRVAYIVCENLVDDSDRPIIEKAAKHEDEFIRERAQKKLKEM